MNAAGPRTIRVLSALTGVLVLGCGAGLAQSAPVLPSRGSVAAGQASIASAGKDGTLITQSSQKALINWQSFSVGAGSSVIFQQPSSTAITLNRVLGAEASTINGNLSANGQIWIINANGILFGAGSRIDVGGLIATTSNIRDSNFLAGIYDFDIASGNPNAAVINRGTINTASGGSAVLSGARVVNEGVIQARLGKVVLGGASGFSVDFDGDNLIRYAVGAPVSETPNDSNGAPAPALVSNSGTIAADGGKVLLTARAARSVVNSVINSTGIVEATSASLQNGEIVFDAGEGGTTKVSGRLDASGKDAGSTGGKIAVLGESVAIADGAKLDASGDSGGGTILIGGNLHGAGPEANAQSASVGQADIAANARSNGNGGTVAIYSTGETDVAAAISARAGATGGDGGTVETSGHDLKLAQTTHVDTSAPAGATGLWLLDPLNINVATGGAAALSGGVDAVGSNPGATDVISPATIVGALASTNVRLEASNDITISDSLIYTSGNSLTFLAGRNVTFNASVQNGGAGAIFAVGGWDGVTAASSILTTPGAYGSSGGIVMIGGNSAPGGVAVGSLTGTTNVAARNLSLQAVNGYAQLGYNLAASGNLTVNLTGDLALTAGNSGSISGSFAQIGNGAASSSGNYGGDIAVTAGGSIALTGGPGSTAYAQIGHGGITSSGTHSGDITVTAGGDLALAGNGGANTYALIGHGGVSSSGLHTGDVTIMAGGDVSIDRARIGHQSGAINGTVLLVAGADLTFASGASVNASDSGDAIVLAAQGNFVNQAGAGVLSVAGGGRWLLFLHDPAKNVTPGGLSASTLSNHAFNFQTGAYAPIAAAGNQFVYTLSQILTVTADSKTRVYGAANPLFTYQITGLLNGDTLGAVVSGAPSLSTSAAGNSNAGNYAIIASLGTLTSSTYSFQFVSGTLTIDPKLLTVALAGSVTKTYDGNLAATLGADNYTLLGAVSGDAVALNNPASGTYATKSVGSGKLVSVSGLALTGSDAGNYVLASSSASGAVGVINAATLTAGLTGSVVKTYDGNLIATLAPGNYTLSGAVSGDAVALNNPASGTYGTKNAGSGKLVSVSGLALSGADAGNYVLASSNASGAVGIINAATLTAGLTGSVSKAYDGNLIATLAPGNYTLSDAVSGDAVALNNPASGTYATKSIGSGKLVSVSGLALTGSDAGNYVLASSNASGAVGTITTATLTAGLTGSVVKTYDGNLVATLGAGNYTLLGAASGDAVALNNPVSGTYATKNAGSGKLVSVSGLALTGADAGNYVLASSNASGAVGIINAATLTAGLAGSVVKTYDGTLTAHLQTSNLPLSGVISGDSVTVNPGSAAYDTKNAGSGKLVSVSGLALSGSDAGNYVLSSTNTSGAVGIINAATLTASIIGSVTKTYDGTAAASLAGNNYLLSGVVAGDTVGLNGPTSGSYDTKNVGSGKLVSVSGLALTGNAGNYVLASSNASGAVGIINAASLTAGLTGSVVKTYDGNLLATLAPGNYTLSGAVSGDAVALNNPASGTYDTKDAGTGKLVSVSGLALNGSDAGNYVLVAASASGAIGEIKAANSVDNSVLAQLGAISSLNASSSGGPAVPGAPTTTVMDAGPQGPMVATMTGAEDTPANVVAISVGQSLSGAAGSVQSSTSVLIDGLLRQYNPPPGGARPRGVPPVDEVYSSWGNEAFWQ